MKKTSTKFNYIYSMIYSILTMILPLITAPYISRVIGAKGLGIYSYCYTVVSYFATFALLGVNFYGNRSIAKVRDNSDKTKEVFSEIYSMQLITSAVMIILYVLYILICVNDNLQIALIMILFVLSPAISVNWFFNGLEMFKITVTRNLIIKIVTVCCTFIFVKNSDDLWKYTAILALGTFFSEGYLIITIRKYVTFVKPKFKNILHHFKPNLILFIPIFAVSIYRSMDKLMLKWLVDYEQVGYYTNAEKVINICLACITALGQVMLPKMTNLLSKGEVGQFNLLIKKSIKFVSFLSIAMMFGIFAVANLFIPIFLGEGYEECIPILELLSINLVLLAWGNVLKSEYLIPKEKDYLYIVSVIIGAVVNFGINITLIPQMQARGAAVGTICAELASLVIIMIYVNKEIKLTNIVLECGVYAIIGGIMFFIVKIVSMVKISDIISLIVQCGIGGMSYVILCCLYWHFRHDEFEGIVKNIFAKIKNKTNKDKCGI